MIDHTTHDSSVKLCECGCGQPAPIARRHNPKLGHVKGHPVRFVCGHAAKVRPIRSPEERFWEKVDKHRPDGCWEWIAGADQHGYGTFWDGERLVKAHRYSFALANRPFPDHLDCLHKCDNPWCVNPAHLFLGTAKDNHTDMVEKGRAVYPPPNQVEGETNGSARYTNAQVREFRRLFAERKMSIAAFAKLHGVNPGTMRRIVHRITYRNA